MTMADKRKIGCAAALLPIFAGFFLGGVICFLICLCGCRSQKSVTTSVAVDSTSTSATTEIGVANSEATSMKNLSLHFDTLEMWLAPDISHSWPISPTPDPDGNATAETAVARPSLPGSSMSGSAATFNLAELLGLAKGQQPIYVRATGTTMGSETATNAKQQEVKIKLDSDSTKVAKREDSNEDIDRTAVSKPPDMTWVLIVGFVILALLIYFKK